MSKPGKIFVVSGPSGVGKTTVVTQAIERLSRTYEQNIERIITYTSREPRPNEVVDKDYIFISSQEFAQKQKEGFFLETNEYTGHHYGSPLPDYAELELGKSFVIVLDLEGSKSANRLLKDATLVWIDPPDMVALRNRLEKRGSEGANQLEKRIEKAKLEIEEAHKIRVFDYFLVNDIFEQAVEELIIVIKKSL